MTNYRRGEVILVKFPYSDMVRYKKRPALVVQDESVETGLSQRVVVQITSNLDRTGDTRVLVRKIAPTAKPWGFSRIPSSLPIIWPPSCPGKLTK
jgi:mRNA interferase MazF